MPSTRRTLAVIAAFGIGLSVAAASVAAVQTSTTSAAPPIVAEVCAACHGRDGNSPDRNVPSLAGQGAAYLLRQLYAFKSQRRTGVMSGVASGLGDADMRVASAWFAQQTARANSDPWPDSDALRRGAAIYRHGIHGKNVPACASCHALDGHGLLPEFPRLAGQHTRYLAAQLRAFRANARLSNPNAMMRAVSARLSDQEIDAVAQYITDLH
jgi:cytochrome c553